MKTDQKAIKNQITTGFASMLNKQDLLNLLNEVLVLKYGEEKASLFTMKQFNFYVNPGNSLNRYSTFNIKKKSGALRKIHAPNRVLNSMLTCLNEVLQNIFEPHHCANGFVPGRSIVDNAKSHIGRNFVFNIDLKDFFHSFDRNQVKLGFMNAPFNLKGDKEPLAFLIASLVTHQIDGDSKQFVLPQGSPTSPTITNILCYNLDRRLNGLAKRFNLTYSRYADDITFSSSYNIFNDKTFLDELNRIIVDDQKLQINPKKTRLQTKMYRQEVTGITVNENPNVSRKYIKEIRMWLYHWEKYGYTKAQQLFVPQYIQDKGHVKKGVPTLLNVLSGKLEYLKMVKGFSNSTYMGLNNRFESLKNKLSQKKDINMVLKIWEEDGIEAAMQFYYYGRRIAKTLRPTDADFGLDHMDLSDFQESDFV